MWMQRWEQEFEILKFAQRRQTLYNWIFYYVITHHVFFLRNKIKIISHFIISFSIKRNCTYKISNDLKNSNYSFCIDCVLCDCMVHLSTIKFKYTTFNCSLESLEVQKRFSPIKISLLQCLRRLVFYYL